MSLPADFNSADWPTPLEFQGMVGAGAAHGIYKEFFRPDGFCKSIAELQADKRTWCALPERFRPVEPIIPVAPDLLSRIVRFVRRAAA